jgi:hypothetical protein
MSVEKLAQIANEFVIKLAERHYDNTAPEDVKSNHIRWVDEETRKEIKENGNNSKYLPHNPPGSIASEKTWDRAKKVVKKYWKKYDEPWAVVYDVYRKMGGKPKKKKKSSKS